MPPSDTLPPATPAASVDLACLVDVSPDILFQITPDGRWSFLSAAWTRVLGHAVSDILGRPMTAFVDARDADGLTADITALMACDSVLDRRLRWRRADGGLVWMALQCRRITDASGLVSGAVGSLCDVTATSQDSAELARQQALNVAIFDTAKAPILVLDGHGQVVRFNRACEHLSGYRAADITGNDVFDLLVPPEDRPGVEAALHEALATGSSRHENRWIHRDGTSRTLLWSNAVLEDEAGPRVIAIGTNITRQRAVEEALRDSERRQREIADLLTEGVFVVDADGRITFLNPAASAMLGWAAQEVDGMVSHDLWHNRRPDGRAYAVADCPVHRCMADGIVVRRHEDWFGTRDGGWLPVALTVAPIIRDGVVTGAVAAFHDISERLAAQERLRESEARYRTLFNGSSDGIFVIGLNDAGRPDHILKANEVACSRLGYGCSALQKMTIFDITDPDSLRDVDVIMERLHAGRTVTFERVHVARDGTRVPVEINASLADYGGHSALIAVARDITERKQAEERIRYLADFDQLTGLPNRAQFTRRCDAEMARASRHGHRVALLFLDLDGFKAVNDTHGHAVGDDLLKVVANRLTESLRKSDVAARQGGDEFVILLPEVDDDATVGQVADKLIATVNQPILVNGLTLRVGVSVGIAISPRDGSTTGDLQRHADAAMYAAKAGGRNRWMAFTPEMEPEGA